MALGLHPAEVCVLPRHHGRWSVLDHVGDFGRRDGDIPSTHEKIIVRECRAEEYEDRGPWALIATGFDSPEQAKAWIASRVIGAAQ